jgi:hypothetical protein
MREVIAPPNTSAAMFTAHGDQLRGPAFRRHRTATADPRTSDEEEHAVQGSLRPTVDGKHLWSEA